MDASDAIGIFSMISLALLLVIFGPWVTMVAINYLFGTAIVWSFKTWCAIIWLAAVFGGVNYSTKG